MFVAGGCDMDDVIGLEWKVTTPGNYQIFEYFERLYDVLMINQARGAEYRSPDTLSSRV